MMYGLGGNYAQAAKGIFETRSTDGQTVSSDADKIRFGLVDSQGKPLQGTWFKPTKGEPKRISEKPPEKIEQLTQEGLAKKLNVPVNTVPSGVYNYNASTGAISAIGAGGQNITMRTEGPPPPGYRYVRDTSGNIEKMEPIPGSEAAQKVEAAKQQAVAKEQSQVQQSQIVFEDIDRVIKLLDEEKDSLNPFKQVTGVSGKAAERLPGSARVTAQGFLDTVKAIIGFDRLRQMREESPTGGALGNITQQELAFLQSVLGSLNLDQDPQELRKTITRLKTYMKSPEYANLVKKAAAYPNAEKYGFTALGESGAPAAPQTAPAAPSAPIRVPEGMSPEAAARWQSTVPVETGTPAAPAAPAAGGWRVVR